jgi:hypothetical protein
VSKSGIIVANQRRCGEKRLPHTAEARAKMSAAKIGHTVSVETRAKISAALLGNKMSAETKAKMSVISKNRIITPETRRKMVTTRRANGRHTHTFETRLKIGAAGKGRKRSLETRAKMRVAQLGRIRPVEIGVAISKAKSGRAVPNLQREHNPNWKGGITPIHQAIRCSLDAKMWRKAVFERDNYTCIFCGRRGAIHADHIKRFADYPELRWVVENGRTLCVDCHRQTPTYGGRKQ